jgi:hypothetical protein
MSNTHLANRTADPTDATAMPKGDEVAVANAVIVVSVRLPPEDPELQDQVRFQQKAFAQPIPTLERPNL